MIKEIFKDREEFFYTANLKVATALATLGFRPKMPNPITRTIRSDGRESTVFWFDAVNDKGQQADDIFRGMTKGSDELQEKDPENPINYVRAALQNREALVDWIRATPQCVQVDVKGKTMLIRRDATEEDRRKIVSQL